MKIAVIGVGGVGGYFGGRLAQGTHEVTMVARGDHLEAIRKDGLRVTSRNGDFQVRPDDATDVIESLRELDVVLMATKLGAFPAVLPRLVGTLKPDAAVIPLQNGFDAHERIALALGEQHALAGTCMVMSTVVGPGHVAHLGIDDPTVVFGELDNRRSARALALAEAFTAVGVNATVPEDVIVAIWDKFMGIGPMSAVGAITRAPAQGVQAVPELIENVTRQALEEALSVAHAKGVRLPDDIIEKKLQIMRDAPPDTMASMARDMVAGNVSEFDDLVGALIHLGESLGVSMPLMHTLYWCLKPQALRARGEVSF